MNRMPAHRRNGSLPREPLCLRQSVFGTTLRFSLRLVRTFLRQSLPAWVQRNHTSLFVADVRLPRPGAFYAAGSTIEFFPFPPVVARLGEPFAPRQPDSLRILDARVERRFPDFDVLSVVRRALARLEFRLFAHVDHPLNPSSPVVSGKRRQDMQLTGWMKHDKLNRYAIHKHTPCSPAVRGCDRYAKRRAKAQKEVNGKCANTS